MRRFLTPLGALCAVATVTSLSSCSTFEQRDVAASVNGHEITFEQLGELAGDSTSASVLREVLSLWVGISLQTDGDVDLTSPDGLDTARNEAVLRLAEEVRGTAKEEYELGIDGADRLCARILTLAATDDADAILEELRDGRDFVDAVQQYSVSESLKGTGGLILDENGVNCVDAATFAQGLAAILESIVAAAPEVGEPTLVEYGDASAPGTLILLLRPYDDLEGADLAEVEHVAVGDAVAASYENADVFVNPRLGRWDASTNNVVEG